ncbi:hypothetical protein [Thalassotalea piscium]|uniref:Oligosaccharide repeat unit polymerase n=1 Tax=Thalassotalea piscium TaxID=1230533 RepID=A0A7X0NFY3_9GAMM|nr:hypothetical protein [Thalassotalea piscium]MBB6542748.1 hypothetical protein [Thalassotalea piscium]
MRISKNSLTILWCGFLLFSSLFAFRLPGIGNSSYWSLALILGSLLLVNNSFSNVKLLVKQKVFYSPIIILLLAALSAFLIPIFHQTYDISMVKTWVNNLFAYIGMSVLACIVVSADARYKNIFKIVFVVLITQAVFVWLMMAIAPLRDLIQGLTKDAATMARMEEYGGARGVGFTSFAAFSFSTIMGALGLYMNFYFAQYRQDKSLILKVIIFFVTIIAGISAGRASIAGFVFGLGFYYFTLGFRHYFTGAMRVGFYCLVLITPLIIYIMSVPALTEVVTSYYKYAFQFLHKYFYAGYVGRSSLDTLDKMYFPLTELQILWGDGKYTGSDGSYYLHTDPGFMRFTLIFGIFPSLVIYFGFLWVMFNYYVINRPYVKNIGVLILAIIGLSFVYHYKGELIMFNVSYMKLIYFIFVSCTLLSLKQKSS